MPYSSTDNLPDGVKNALPAAAQKVFLAAFNAAMSKGDDEETANKKAWGAVKNAGFEKQGDKWVKASMVLHSEPSYVSGNSLTSTTGGSYQINPNHPNVVELADDIPELETVTIRAVELLHSGKFEARTGPITVTPGYLASIVEASKDNEVREPVLKIGHADSRFNKQKGDGNPAFGWIRNLRLAEAGEKLVGDLVGIPRRLASMIVGSPDAPAPYRSRSVELEHRVKTPSGNSYEVVMTALALLGEQEPAVASLDDVMNLYTAASAPSGEAHEKISLGEFSFSHTSALTSDAESETNKEKGMAEGDQKTTAQELTIDLAFTRQALGLAEDVPEKDVEARLKEFMQGHKDTVAALADEQKKAKDLQDKIDATHQVEEGMVKMSKAKFEEVERLAREGAAARQAQIEGHRNEVLDWAENSGRIAPGEREYFSKMLEANPEVTEGHLRGLKESIKVPVSELGSSNAPVVHDNLDDDAFYKSLFDDQEAARG